MRRCANGPEDIPALVDAFVRRHSKGEPRSLSQEALALLQAQPWRGNARELENVIERALALCDEDEIRLEDLPGPPGGGESESASAEGLMRSAAEQRLPLRELGDRYVDHILELTGGNKVRAARILGVDRKTLYRRAERRVAREASSEE